MKNSTKRNNSLEKRLKEQEEERINNQIYLGWLDNDTETFVSRLARKYNNKLAIVNVMIELKKNHREAYDELKEWFKFPYHLNIACNIYRIVVKYYKVDKDQLTGFIAWLWDNYEHKAWEMWHDKYKSKGYKEKYTDAKIKKALKAHGFKPMKDVEFNEDRNWIYSHKFKMIYPKSFDAPINSLDIKSPGIYLAGRLYGFPGHTALYIAPTYGMTESAKSTARWIKRDTK